jgi:hypothetical protein
MSCRIGVSVWTDRRMGSPLWPTEAVLSKVKGTERPTYEDVCDGLERILSLVIRIDRVLLSISSLTPLLLEERT